VTEDEELVALVRRYGLPAVQLDAMELEAAAIAVVPAELAQRHQVMPVALADGVLILAMANPLNIAAIDDLFLVTRRRIEPVVATRAQIAAAIAKHYPSA
jgi:type IV pilus assembly protein PilB